MGKHGPNPRFENYKDVHDEWIRRFKDAGFILHDGLQWVALGSDAILLSGRIVCEGGCYIDVRKVIAVLLGEGLNAKVQCVSYQYHAGAHGLGPISRYDSPHPDHHKEHHVHRYDLFGSAEPSTIFIENENDRPTLGEAIEELYYWYYDNQAKLSELREAQNAPIPEEGIPIESAWGGATSDEYYGTP